MQLFLSALIGGWFTGWAVTRLADFAPSLAQAPSTTHDAYQRSRPHRGPALLMFAAHKRGQGWLEDAATEAVCIGIGLILAIRYGATTDTLLVGAFCAFLILIAVIDMRYRLVLNVMTYPAMLLLFLVALTSGGRSLLYAGIGGSFAFVIFYMTARLRPGELGGGDVKLAAVLGLGFGFPQILFALLLGAGSAAVIATGMLVSGRGDKKTRIPYAPFLCFGAVLLLLTGMPIAGG